MSFDPVPLHRAMRPMALEAIRVEFESKGPWKTRDPYAAELGALSCVAILETLWGTGWKPPGAGSNNMGAMQAGKAWMRAGLPTFTYTDTHPNPDGTSTPYQVPFKAYATPVDGLRDLARWLIDKGIFDMVRQDPTCETLSRTLFAKGYYEGFGKTREERIQNHLKAALRARSSFARAFPDEPFLLAAPGEPLPKPKVFSLPDNPDHQLKLSLALLTDTVRRTTLEELRQARYQMIGWDSEHERFVA